MDAGNFLNREETTNPKSLSSAVLGVPKSHGVKLSLMTSEDKKEFMQKLEEWRKIRREKLAAKILAKQKLVEKPKLPVSFASSKTKSVIPRAVGIPKFQDKESVFERLYKGNGKLKNPEVNDISKRITEARNVKRSMIATANKALKVSEINALPAEYSEVNKCELVLGESLNDLYGLSNDPGVSTTITDTDDGKLEATEQFLEETNLPSKEVSYFAKHKKSEHKLVNNNTTVTEKMQISNTSKLIKPSFKNLPPNIEPGVRTHKTNIPLRRSLSMLFRQKNRTENIKRSLSEKSILELNANMRTSEEGNEINPKNEIKTKSVSFVTPKSKEFSSAHLRSKLEDWLKKNGHSLEGYRHLRCFGLDNHATLLQPGFSIESDHPPKNSHFSKTPTNQSSELDKENKTPPTVIPQVDVTQVENWLKELHVLISKMKYPSDRCEEWLAAIRKKYPKCSQLPIYWECLASLNESKGDIKSAIEDYERAIIKGGQVESVGNSLAQLFDKMVIEQKKPTKSKTERGIDPKNIFKSTIIKFALQQKTLKRLEPKISPDVREQLYIATPVRRSSRLQTFLKSKEVNSLETLTPDVKKNLTFKPNECLLEAD